jgi:DNA-binding NarL/FixJ family response regulator
MTDKDTLDLHTSTEKATPPEEQKHILFVEKSDLFMDMSLMRFSKMGYKATGSLSTWNALDIFKAAPLDFDLVIIDHNLLEMTKYNLAKEILSIRPDIPIILHTDFHGVAIPEDAKEAGIKACVSKTAGRQEVQELIEKVLEG